MSPSTPLQTTSPLPAAPQDGKPTPNNERGYAYSYCSVMKNEVPPPATVDERGYAYSYCTIM